jgi:hypothetical protein
VTKVRKGTGKEESSEEADRGKKQTEERSRNIKEGRMGGKEEG